MARERMGLALAVMVLALPLTGCTSNVGTVSDEDEDPAEDVDIRRVHDFSGAEETVRQEVEIPENSGPYDVRLRIEPPDGEGPCAAQDAQVAFLDPNGTQFAEASTMLTVAESGESCGASTDRTNADLEAGTWTVRFSGNGSARGVLTVQN